jgi:hypothetical protein
MKLRYLEIRGGLALRTCATGLLLVACGSNGQPAAATQPDAASPGPSESQVRRYDGQAGNYEVVTHHYDGQRQGVQRHESHFRPSNVTGIAVRATATLGMGYPASQRYTTRVFAQPLFARDVLVNGTHQDVVYVVDTNAQVWAFTPELEPIAGLPAGNPRQLEPPWAPAADGGIMGTPVIDEATNRMYLVNRSTLNLGDPVQCPGNAAFWLHSLDLNTMLDDDQVHGTPRVQICASATNEGVANVFRAERQFQRPALLKNGSYLYVAFGSGKNAVGGEGGTCQHGWVMTFDVSQTSATEGPKFVGAYVSSRFADTDGCPDVQLNNIGNVGIWMAGTGPAADYAGNVYIMTANGLSDAANDANSLVRLSPTGLRTGSYLSPYPNYATGADLDFGSAGPIVVDSVEGHVVASGKLGYANVVSTATMQPVAPSDILVSTPQWLQVDPSNCSSQPVCDANGVPSGGPNICCPFGCDAPDATTAWNLIQNRIADKPQPFCAGTIGRYLTGTWSNPVFWNNRVYFWPQADYLSYVPWDATNHRFAGKGTPMRVGNKRLPNLDPVDRSACAYGTPNCQVSGSSDANIILSVNQDDESSAVIFAATWGGYDGLSPSLPTGALYAFDANGSNVDPLWTSNDLGLWRNFTYPIVADGGLYVMNAGRHTSEGWWPPQLLLYY